MDEDDIVAAHNTSCVVVLIAGNGSVRRLLALPAMIEEMFDSSSFSIHCAEDGDTKFITTSGVLVARRS